MPITLCNSRTALKLLVLQLLLVLVLCGMFFVLKGRHQGVSALLGGTAVLLPNMAFILMASFSALKPNDKNIAWYFALGEVVKVIATILLLIVALVWFNARFFPLGLAYIATLFMQVVIPAFIYRHVENSTLFH